MKILAVCLGNICRSPMAEELLRAKFPSDYYIDSAGTSGYHEGEAPDPRAIECMKHHGLDISSQKSRPLRTKDFEEFDLIYCMDDSNYRDIISKCPSAEYYPKIQKITTVAGFPNEIIEDPYYGGAEAFEATYLHLDKITDILAEQIRKA